MKILITGVAGFIGSSLAERCLSDGNTVYGVDVFTDNYRREIKENNLEKFIDNQQFNFTEIGIQELCKDDMNRIDIVFHLAAVPGVRDSWGVGFEKYIDNNIRATQILLELVKNLSLKKFIYASSSSVYGDVKSIVMSETTAPHPMSPYGVTKLAGEHLCMLYQKNYGVPAVALRYFTAYGPRQRPDMAFHKLFKAVHTESPFPLFGDGTQTRDFTYIDDIVQANILAVKKGVPGKVYNIGGGSRVSMNDVIEMVERITGKIANIDYIESQLGDVRDTSANILLAQSELGYSPTTSLWNGLVKEYEWICEAEKAREHVKKTIEISNVEDVICDNSVPRLSVLMCVFNAENTVSAAIQSILDQSYTDFEFIIVDDGSTDQTGNIIDRFNDNRIKKITNKENIGLTKSLNVGLRECRGELIARQDADDISLEGRFEKQIEFLDSHVDCWLTGCWLNLSGSDSGKKHMPEYPPAKGKTPLENLVGVVAPGSSMFWRDKIIRYCGGYDSNFKYAQDFKQYVDIVRAGGEIGATQYEGYEYTVDAPGSITVDHRAEQKICGDRIKKYINIPKVGILIISCNRKFAIEKSIQQLINNTETPYSLYLLDNGSTDGATETMELFRDQYPELITLIRVEENLGCPGGRKYAMQFIDNEYIAWIDDDMFVEPGWLPPLVKKMDSDTTIGAVCMKWLQKKGEIYNIGGHIKSLGGDHAIIYHPQNPETTMNYLDYFSGGASLLRRAAYNWLEAQPTINGMEDVYLGLKMKRDKWKIVGEPSSQAVHKHDKRDTNYFKTRQRSGKNLRESVDRIKKEFGIRLIRNRGWAHSARSRVLLLFPPSPLPGSVKFGLPPPLFPHGIESIATYLRGNRQTVRVIDYRVENPDIAGVIKDFDPDWIGCYTTTVGWEYTENWLRNIRKLTDAAMVVGGPHATLFPEKIPDWIDYVICGEGEEAFFLLIDREECDKRITIASRLTNDELNALPLPSFGRLAAKKGYAKTDNQNFGLTDMASLNTSRGCPFSCRFCSGRKILGKKYTALQPDRINRALNNLKNLGYKSVYFREDNWSANKQRAIDIASVCARHGLRFAAETRVDTLLDNAIIGHMAHCGCAGFYIGVESGSQQVLDSMNKNITVPQIVEFFDMCHHHGIKTYASMIVGYPGETDNDLQESIRLIQKIKPGKVGWCPFVGMPGSNIAEDMLLSGDYGEKDSGGILYPKDHTENRRRCVRYEKEYGGYA